MNRKKEHEKKHSMPENVPVYQVKIILQDTDPVVWRKILVRSDVNLGLFHAIVQLVMGWTNSHLHQYFIHDKIYSDPEFEIGAEFVGDTPALDEYSLTLAGIASGGQTEFGYEYDFGDSWRHTIIIERQNDESSGFQGLAMCIAGSRACPPDDCGGTGGFADLLQTIKNPKHEEYKSMMKWLGGKYDPELCDIAKINKCLQKIKQPDISAEQLAKILMQRDGYRE
jgi:hypothetical protein